MANWTVFLPGDMLYEETVVPGLERAGCRIKRGPRGTPGVMVEYPPEQLDALFGDVDAIIATPRELYPRAVLAAARKLRIISSAVIGTEQIDVDAATEMGIVVAHGAVPENYLGVSEAVVLLALALVRELKRKERDLRSLRWRPSDPGHMLWRRTFGLIGLGRVGVGVAERLQGWGVRMLGYDPYVAPEVPRRLGVELTDLDTLLRESDVVSIHVTLTDETRHLIGERELALMKPSAYLINTARGAAVDEQALARALAAGRIAGAGIDVWEREPPLPDNPLLQFEDNAILTPHNLAHSQECYDALAQTAIENTLRGLRGEEPVYVKNPRVLPQWHERLRRLSGS
ncbi:MAG: dehydrogenase [Chloroflexi bacterium]|nr:dehydrogenase [Chloroflexota bacterium]